MTNHCEERHRWHSHTTAADQTGIKLPGRTQIRLEKSSFSHQCFQGRFNEGQQALVHGKQRRKYPDFFRSLRRVVHPVKFQRRLSNHVRDYEWDVLSRKTIMSSSIEYQPILRLRLRISCDPPIGVEVGWIWKYDGITQCWVTRWHNHCAFRHSVVQSHREGFRSGIGDEDDWWSVSKELFHHSVCGTYRIGNIGRMIPY